MINLILEPLQLVKRTFLYNIYFFHWSGDMSILVTNTKFPLRTPQRPQPSFDPNRVCIQFTFWWHKCTHFALPIHTYVEACVSNTLLGSVVHLCSHNVIQSV
jgi:hypothetical protein